ncbi:MAG TPA: FAD-binding and (Fe-S)-binding domain-containing protein [Thermoanaerobaculia bacterium]
MSDGDLTPNVDSDGLAAALAKAIRGEVRFDAGSRALYATDSSNYRQVPIGVVVPRDRDDVLETLALCRRFGAPILGRGAGTSLAGQCCNVAVVLDTSKYFHRILEVDAAAKTARVEPGAVLDDLRDAAERHGLTFGPDPATHACCTLGGMIGNNSCGVHSVMAGKTDDNVEELEVVAGDGTLLTVGRTSEADLERIVSEGGRRSEIYAKLRDLRDRFEPLIRSRYPDIPRRVSGYNLPHLLPENGFDVARALVGSEGTCVFVLEAKLRLVWSPPARVLVVLGYSDVFAAADAVPEILEHRPIGLEGFDDGLMSDMERTGLFPENRRLLPEGRGWLLVEMGAAELPEALAAAKRLVESVASGGAVSARVFDRREEAARVWQVRQAALGATAHVPGSPLTWEGWEDAAVSPQKLGAYLRDLRALLDRFGYRGDLYGHFGQGCVHTRTDFDLATREGIAKFRAFLFEAADLVVGHGGSLSGEHGDGQSRAELLPRMFGPELVGAFREFKAIWDPQGLMNPGKIVDAYRADENLRVDRGPLRNALPNPAFAYANDAGDFSRALQRCVGVGECRRAKGGTMCPSYMVTREEKHSTRGRAKLLDEMLRGEVLTGGWREESVRQALDLCLACKGCKSDCPVGVDVAAWKAEFLSRYYRGRVRPAAAYAMGLVDLWARLASGVPALANFVTQTPGLAALAKTLGGIAPGRRLPPFAGETFRSWFARRRASPNGGKRVLLFPDTFTNHFSTGIARDAVELLEEAGFAVTIPGAPLCCGRPLYDFGMLGRARRLLGKVLDVLSPAVDAGTPVVVLEPSCASVFRDELPELFPKDERAARLSRSTLLLAELFEKEARQWRPRALGRRALVAFHCHQRAIFGIEADRRLLLRAGLEVEIPDSGCCGMAGSFGFERSHFDVSLAIGERVLLPAVRAAAPETLLIADGFSCREQIAQVTGRSPLHSAQVLRIAAGGTGG